MNLNIKVGDKWETRSGKIFPITKIEESGTMPVLSGKYLCWQLNGRYWDDSIPHSMDLVKKILQ